jgi:predicted nucleic acid-binding protein
MKGFLLDTNILSELMNPRPDPGVVEWLQNANDEQLYLSVITLGEILKGIAQLPLSKKRRKLQEWLDKTLRPWFDERILPVNEAIAGRWGLLAAECKLKGRPLKVADGFIAATALENDLTVVTRNVRDFTGLGVEILNPWDGAHVID